MALNDAHGATGDQRMMQGFDPQLPMPPYVRRIDSPGGELRRAFLYALLRLTTKGTSYVDADIGALRLEQSKWDARFAPADPSQRRTPLVAAGLSGDWIDGSGRRLAGSSSSTRRFLDRT